MIALNQAVNVKPLEFFSNKTLYKTFVVGQGESGIMLDQPFGNCIPEKLTMVLVNMSSMSGNTILNTLYFKHCNLPNVHVTINGTSMYNVNTDFDTGNHSHMIYETQKPIGIDTDNMKTHANLRLPLSFKNNVTSPHVVILLADIKGIISIDNQCVVTCDVRGKKK